MFYGNQHWLLEGCRFPVQRHCGKYLACPQQNTVGPFFQQQRQSLVSGFEAAQAQAWAQEDMYVNPGPVQFGGAVGNLGCMTLELEKA